MNRPNLLTIIFLLGLAARGALAAPLTEAKVTKIVNEVKVLDPAAGQHSATLNEVIRNDIALQTGIKSRSELVFQDETLTRIGPETYFSFKAGTRNMALKQGTMLLQVPKGIGGAKIRAASVTASITGTTIMMEHTLGGQIKVLVLEGALRLTVDHSFGESVLLTAGRMVIMPENAKHIPDPVAVDIARVVKTSTLVNMGKSRSNEPALPSLSLIEKEIAQQQIDQGNGLLLNTDLAIFGRGSDMIADNNNLLTHLDDNQRLHDVHGNKDHTKHGNNGHGHEGLTTAPAATPAKSERSSERPPSP